MVGTRWMMVTSPGARFFLQYSYLNQNLNWSGSGQVSSELNSDKLISTSFYTFGLQYGFNRDWGMMLGSQVWDRYVEGIDDGGNPYSVRHHALGDTKVMGMYTGFSEDMSTALMFGVKLPTGPIDQSHLDRDTQIGTGTTDALLSAYQMDQEDRWGWYVQGALVYPLNEREGYRPGNDFNAAFGVHYDALITSHSIAPIASVVASIRGQDSGSQSDPANTGFTRIFFAPGVELLVSQAFHVDAEFGVPLYSHVNGYQLISPYLLNATISYQF
jgi:hypothetical protein